MDGKYIKDDVIKYGIWKDGKREKWFDNEDEFVNFLEPKDEKYIFAFQCNHYKLKKIMELNDSDDESENETSKDNETIKEFQRKKNDQSEEEEEDEDD